jgi:hypothetical protein
MEKDIEEQRESGRGNKTEIILRRMMHLPKDKDIASSEKSLGKAFSERDERDRTIATHSAKLLLMCKELYADRESLKPVLTNVSFLLSEWDAWLETGEGGEATEEDLQENLERVASAIAFLRETMDSYEAGVLAKLKG